MDNISNGWGHFLGFPRFGPGSFVPSFPLFVGLEMRTKMILRIDIAMATIVFCIQRTKD